MKASVKSQVWVGRSREIHLRPFRLARAGGPDGGEKAQAKAPHSLPAGQTGREKGSVGVIR